MKIDQAIEMDNELNALSEFETVALPGWRSFADVKPRKQPFLLPGIPENNITLFVSDGGTGKGFLSCHLAAAISTGSATILDNEPVKRDPERVILINTEDSDDCVIVQRLIDAGADLSLIDTREENAPVPTIFSVIARMGQIAPKLVILDPLQSFVPKGTKMGNRNEMRKVMEPLQQAANLYKCAIVIIMHTNKTFGTSGRGRVADSSDMWDIARSVFIMGETYDGQYTKYLSHEKNNYGKQMPTILYRIDDAGIYKVGETDKKDHDFVSEHNKKAGGRPPARREEAKEFIVNALQDAKEGMTGKQLSFLADQNGISQSTYARARRELVENDIVNVTGSGRGKDVAFTYKLNEESLYT